jgi:hypothetical protein
MRKGSGFRRIILIAVLGCCACEHIPSAPTPPSGPVPPSPTATVRVEGRVIDAETERPIPGATVRTLTVCPPERCGGIEGTTATANETGMFVLTVEIAEDWRNMLLSVTAGGYEATQIYINPAVAMDTQLRLLRTLTIRPGESIDMQVFLGHYVCGDESHLCRRVFVEPAGKPIDLEVISADSQREVGLFVGHPLRVTSYPRRMTVSNGEVWIYAGGAERTGQRSGVLGVFHQKVPLVAHAN